METSAQWMIDNEITTVCTQTMALFRLETFYTHTRGIVWVFYILGKNSTTELNP